MSTTPVTPAPIDQLDLVLEDAVTLAGTIRSERTVATATLADEQRLRAAAEAARDANATALAAAMKRIQELTTAPPVEGLPFGIGINEAVMSSKFPMIYTLAALEKASGVKFAYVRGYFTYPTSGVASSSLTFIEKHLKAGRVPIVSYKLPGDDWSGAANGKYDAVIDATKDATETLVLASQDAGFTRARVQDAEHHEMDNGDGPLTTYMAMMDHLAPIVRRPGRIELWADFTGYAQLFQAASEEFTFDKVNRDYFDGYAIDPYLSMFQKPSNTTKATMTDLVTAYFEPFAKWCDAHGKRKAVWETGFTAKAQASTLPKIKTFIPDIAAAGQRLGFDNVTYWNNYNPNSGNDWRIQDIAPAMSKDQMVTAMRAHAW